ncbi:MAG: extracellular solute-binding protein [Pelagimonas sp.]|uniref:extracellular solute-binding protein n=1 Tax=Pelagimonas sp. TaxID=2073170 RepID=UPI003D6A9CED
MGLKTTTLCVSAAMLMTAASSVSAQDVELDYWVYADFATGAAGDLQETFIKEFQDANPGVTINMTGRGGGDLTAGTIAGAASGDIPDIFMNTTAVGAQLDQAGALANIYPYWKALPEDVKAQFNKDLIDLCTPAPEKMLCIPYTGYGSFMYRNLGVLEAAGIDPNAPIETWDQWLAQMEKIKGAGKTAVPDMSLIWFSILDIYAGLVDESKWGIDWDAKKTLIDPVPYAKALEVIAKMEPYSSGTSLWDQATNDLFTSGELAFSLNGPWAAPGYAKAAEANADFKYDYVLVPGPVAGSPGGVQGYEMIGIAPNDNAETAFKFAMHVVEKKQMVRWARELGRYNSNEAALNDPSVADDPLIKITGEAIPGSLYNRPPFFSGIYPADYYQTMVDFAQEVVEGDMTPEEAAKATVEALNKLLADS